MHKPLLRTAKAFSLGLALCACPLAAVDTVHLVALPGPGLSVPGIPLKAPPTGDWPKYCGNAAMTGSSTGGPISVATAPSLSLLWSQKLLGAIASSPSVARGKVYIGDWGGREWAFDEETGGLVAAIDLGRTSNPSCNPPNLGVTSAAAIDGDTLYIAGGDNAFYALDADTLAVRWRSVLGDNSPGGGYYGWSSPSVVNGRVIQGIASNCINPFVQGKVIGLDVATGDIVSQRALVPNGETGAGVWSSPCVDEMSGSVFVSTGSAPSNTEGMASSIVRLSLDDLSIRDSWRPVSAEGDDWWDADWGSSPTLFLDRDGRLLVGAGHKDGNYYAFLRSDLVDGPVWTTTIAAFGSVPQSGEGTLSTAAFDGSRLYVGGGVPPDAPEGVGGSVTALDTSTGATLWRRFFPGTVVAPVSVVNGVVFGVGGTSVFAMDSATGDVLWSFQAKVGGYGGVAIAHGRIYFGDLSGTFYAFGLPSN